MDRLDRVLIGSANTVDLIGKTDAWNTIAVSLSPDGFALRFHTLNGVKNNNTAIQYSERALHFGGEIDMSRCINDIDLITLPLRGYGCRDDGNTTFPFLFHPVGHSSTVIHRSDTISFTGIE